MNLNSKNKLSSSIGQFSSISGNIPRAASDVSNQITLFKEISKSSALIPGEIISITIQIDNNIGDLQFYALDDIIPAGTSYQENSVEITGVNLQEGGENTISIDQTASGMHVFFPVLPLGIIEITYQIQVESLKNSYLGLCTLWGMYDNITITANPIVIENIPRKYNLDNSIYRDLTSPIINNVEYVQIEETSEIEVKINFFAEDDNSIHKIRVVYSQGFGWRAKQMYTFENGEFTVEIKDLENVDSSLDFFIEATDIYGNIISTLLSTLVIRGTLIPYIAIGGLIVLSLGLAGVATIFHKRRIESSRTQQSQIDGFTRNKEGEISFIDETN